MRTSRTRSRANVARAVKTGVAGLSIEDFTGDNAKPLYERALAVERIKAARKAIDADNSGVLLTGRCEGFLRGLPILKHGDRPAHGLCRGRRRLPLCAGHLDHGRDRSGREGGAPKPVNLLIGAPGLSLQEAADLGVRRISVGGALARTAWAGFMKAAQRDGGARARSPSSPTAIPVAN